MIILGSLGSAQFRSRRGAVDPKFQVEGVARHQPSSFQKTRLNDLSYGIKIWTDYSSVLSQFTRLTDGRTDRQTEISSLDSVCIPCSAVKIIIYSLGIDVVTIPRVMRRTNELSSSAL